MTRTTHFLTHKPFGPAEGGVRGAGFLVLLVALLVVSSWLFFKAFIVASVLTGAGAALLLGRWHARHPSQLPDPARGRVPEINLSRIPVEGDVAGLMFAVGGVVIVVIGVPDMAWYSVGSLSCAALFAWATFAVRAARARPHIAERPLGLR